MYIRYEDLWVDASPTVIPPPSTYLEGLRVGDTTISSVDSTGTVSIATGISNQWTFGLDGVLTLPNGQLDYNAPYSRFKDANNTGVQLGSPDDQNYVNVDNNAVTIQVNSDGVTGPHALDQHNWTFGTDGALTLPGLMTLPVTTSTPAITTATGTVAVCDGAGWNGGNDGLQHLMIYINNTWTKVI
jgi:hypothetical protein